MSARSTTEDWFKEASLCRGLIMLDLIWLVRASGSLGKRIESSFGFLLSSPLMVCMSPSVRDFLRSFKKFIQAYVSSSMYLPVSKDTAELFLMMSSAVSLKVERW